jgi:hypothetical protein
MYTLEYENIIVTCWSEGFMTSDRRGKRFINKNAVMTLMLMPNSIYFKTSDPSQHNKMHFVARWEDPIHASKMYDFIMKNVFGFPEEVIKENASFYS